MKLIANMKTAYFIGALSVLWAQNSIAQNLARMHAAIDTAVSQGQFSGSVFVTQGDRVLIDKGYGQANMEWKQPNTPQTKFRIGSISKQFTAAALLLLEERGKLKLSDNVKQYVDDIPATWDNITIAHLLNHTAGLRNFTGLPAYEKIKMLEMKPAETLKLVRDLPLDFAVGTEFRYSNSGYVLLGQIIEKVSGDSYASFLEKNIFKPFGMKSSSAEMAPTILLARAAGYKYVQSDERAPPLLINADYISMTVPHAAGAIISTTHDLQRWQRALYSGKVLSAASLKKLTTPHKNGYALGVQLVELRGSDGGVTSRRMAHGGGIDGFAAWMQYKEPSGLSVVVLGNIEQAASGSLAVKLAAMAEGTPPFGTTPFYLRGSMNKWGITDRMVLTAPQLWTVEVALNAGDHEFKFGSEDFSQIDFGRRDGEQQGKTALLTGRAQPLHFIGSNLKIVVPSSATYRFSLDARDAYGPKLSVVQLLP